MAYPDLPTAYGSDPKPIGMIKVDRAEDGSARARATGGDKMAIPLVHPRLSSADKATLDAYYSANRLLEFDYVSKADGNTYTCVFAKAPRYEVHPGSRWTATVELEEV